MRLPRWRGREAGDAPPRREPFELWLVATCAITGLVSLLPLGITRTDAITRFLPDWAPVWYAGLLLAGLTTTAGLLWRARTLHGLILALTLEGVGLALLAGLLAGFGVALEVAAPASPVGVLLIGLTVASATRVRYVRWQLRRLVDDARRVRRVLDEDELRIGRDAEQPGDADYDRGGS